MAEFELSAHARDMLLERRIEEGWVRRTIQTPRGRSKGVDGNVHYTKPIRERQGRQLHVVVNPTVSPQRIVTVFFDRRLGRAHEIEDR